jgi:hypothetical protein
MIFTSQNKAFHENEFFVFLFLQLSQVGGKPPIWPGQASQGSQPASQPP